MSQLTKRAVLMRLRLGMPGEFRQDKTFTSEVKEEHNLGDKAGKWIKHLYPPEALEKIKELDNKARKFHLAVTLPFDSGIGILPAVLIKEYSDRMRDFRAKRDNLVESTFIAKYPQFIEWARQNHNGTFDESLYPEADEIRKQFIFQTEPLPVPDVQHFETNVKQLVGLDADSVNIRIEDATREAQKELLKRMLEPVANMAKMLKKEKPIIFDTLVTNIADIAKLAPAMNLMDDPEIVRLASLMESLADVKPDDLRKKTKVRDEKQRAAEELMQRLSGYKF